MKKFRITDDEGAVYEVEPVEEEKEVFETGDEDKTKCADEELSDEEIMALKRLAAIADDLIKLLDVENKEHATTPDDEVEETLGDEDEEKIDDEVKEEVIDTDEDKTSKKDSRKSFGSLLKGKNINDSSIDYSLDVEQAWNHRYKKDK